MPARHPSGHRAAEPELRPTRRAPRATRAPPQPIAAATSGRPASISAHISRAWVANWRPVAVRPMSAVDPQHVGTGRGEGIRLLDAQREQPEPGSIGEVDDERRLAVEQNRHPACERPLTVEVGGPVISRGAQVEVHGFVGAGAHERRSAPPDVTRSPHVREHVVAHAGRSRRPRRRHPGPPTRCGCRCTRRSAHRGSSRTARPRARRSYGRAPLSHRFRSSSSILASGQGSSHPDPAILLDIPTRLKEEIPCRNPQSCSFTAPGTARGAGMLCAPSWNRAVAPCRLSTCRPCTRPTRVNSTCSTTPAPSEQRWMPSPARSSSLPTRTAGFRRPRVSRERRTSATSCTSRPSPSTPASRCSAPSAAFRRPGGWSTAR